MKVASVERVRIDDLNGCLYVVLVLNDRSNRFTELDSTETRAEIRAETDQAAHIRTQRQTQQVCRVTCVLIVLSDPRNFSSTGRLMVNLSIHPTTLTNTTSTNDVRANTISSLHFHIRIYRCFLPFVFSFSLSLQFFLF